MVGAIPCGPAPRSQTAQISPSSDLHSSEADSGGGTERRGWCTAMPQTGRRRSDAHAAATRVEARALLQLGIGFQNSSRCQGGYARVHGAGQLVVDARVARLARRSERCCVKIAGHTAGWERGRPPRWSRLRERVSPPRSQWLSPNAASTSISFPRRQ
jgi:hypothetical protein